MALVASLTVGLKLFLGNVTCNVQEKGDQGLFSEECRIRVRLVFVCQKYASTVHTLPLISPSSDLEIDLVWDHPIHRTLSNILVDRSQPLFYFVPQDSHNQAGSTNISVQVLSNWLWWVLSCSQYDVWCFQMFYIGIQMFSDVYKCSQNALVLGD